MGENIEKEDLNSIGEISKYEIMRERGTYIANGFRFDIEPVRYTEEEEYFQDVPLSLVLQNSEEEITLSDLARLIATLFKVYSKEEIEAHFGKFGKLKLWLAKHFRKDYKYYSDNPKAVGLVKWMEKKVRYNNKRIRFFDLERKFKLTKDEIAGIFLYMHKLSGF